MKALRSYLDTHGDIPEAAGIFAEFSQVQAVHIEPNPAYLSLFCLERIADIDPYGLGAVDDHRAAIDQACVDYDVAYTPTTAAYALLGPAQYEQLGPYLKEKRLLMRVHLCASRFESSVFFETREQERQAIADKALALLAESDVLVVLEERRRTVMAVGQGDGITNATQSKDGTMGGFFENSVGQRMGVTCAHVAQPGNLIEDSAGIPIGPCQWASAFLGPSHGFCRPDGNAMTNAMDAALINCAPGMSVQTGLRESALFGSGMQVQMRGARSGGPNSYYFGSLGLVHAVDMDGQKYCFRDLVSFRPQSTLPFAGALTALVGHRAQRGDSGAWLTDAAGSEWYAMMFAVDGTEGFAIDATSVLDWARTATGDATLRVC